MINDNINYYYVFIFISVVYVIPTVCIANEICYNSSIGRKVDLYDVDTHNIIILYIMFCDTIHILRP